MSKKSNTHCPECGCRRWRHVGEIASVGLDDNGKTYRHVTLKLIECMRCDYTWDRLNEGLTPLRVFQEFYEEGSPDYYRMMHLCSPGGGALSSDFWRWCFFTAGFPGVTAGTANMPCSHGTYMDVRDVEPFRCWISNVFPAYLNNDV